MLSWKEYDMKCEQYADMRRDVITWEQLREAQRRRRMTPWAWVARRLGRSMMVWGARLEARPGSYYCTGDRLVAPTEDNA